MISNYNDTVKGCCESAPETSMKVINDRFSLALTSYSELINELSIISHRFLPEYSESTGEKVCESKPQGWVNDLYAHTTKLMNLNDQLVNVIKKLNSIG